MIKASLTEMGYETILLPYFWSYNAIITGYHIIHRTLTANALNGHVQGAVVGEI